MIRITLPAALMVFGGLLVYFGLIITGQYFYARFLAYLQAEHGALWQSLGSPTFVKTRRNFSYRLKDLSFVVLRRYKKVGDPELTRLGNAAFAGVLVVPILFVIFLLFLGWW